jgi:hypothetical protein
LAETLKALVVDVGYPNRRRLIGPWLKAQKLVEDVQPKLHEQHWLPHPGKQSDEQYGQRDQIVQVPADVAAELPHCIRSSSGKPAGVWP